jgi:sensor c-di-GMP phosphodiesterase-like protein
LLEKMNGERGVTKYLTLLIIIVIGVTAGNLLANWIAMKVVEHQVEQALVGISNEVTTQMNKAQRETSELRAKARAESEAQESRRRQQRLADKTGTALARACEEWKRAHEEFKSYTSETESAKHCGRLERYLTTGVVPRR